MPTDDAPARRLHKMLAAAGVGSLRRCEALIREGRVTVDGMAVSEMGFMARPGSLAEVDGTPVRLPDPGGNDRRAVYVLLNKPAGVISSAKDQFGRRTVVDIVGNGIPERVYPVGRLDYETRGLILLTDDGGFAYRATHPKFNVEKAYVALFDRVPSESDVAGLIGGVVLSDGFRTSPARVFRDGENDRMLTIALREGKYRQVRRMAAAVGLETLMLTRIAIGGLTMGKLSAGEWRILSRNEAHQIFKPYSHSI